MDRLSPLSAAFLLAENMDEDASMAISSTAVFEGPAPTQEELMAHVRGRLPLMPKFRQVVRSVPFDLGAPLWVDDPDFELAWHVRRTAVPAPGSEAEVNRLIARVMSQRMDRNRPLWEYWVVEGLSGGRWALIQKVHHCVVDGVSGTEMYNVVFDTTPEPRPAAPDTWVPSPAPNTTALAGAAALELALLPVAGARALGSLVRNPSSLARQTVQAARGGLSLSGALLPVTTTSVAGPSGKQRRYRSTGVDLADVAEIRAAFSVSVNDVALAAITAGFRDLLLSRGEEPAAHAVRSLVPVSVREPGDEAIPDNQVSLLLPYLPVEVDGPRERLRAVHQRIREAASSGEAQAGVAFTSVLGYEPFLPVAIGLRLAFRVPQHMLATVTTNVPGPRSTIYALGRRCEAIVPWVPISSNIRIGLAMFSYAGRLTFGVTSDRRTTPDVDVLVHGIEDGLAELLAAARAA